MTLIMIDASAWIECLRGTEIGARVQKCLERNKCMTPSIIVSEICSHTQRTGFDPEAAFRAVATTEIVPLTAELSKTAGLLHARHKTKNDKFSIGDAVLLATARKFEAKILTKDGDFRNMPEAILLK